MYIVISNDVTTDGQFNPPVLHLANIFPDRSDTGQTADRHLIKYIIGLLVIIINIESQSILKQGCIHPKTGCIGFFPSQIFITDLAN
ncbi:hypothetical protein D3C81_1865410 [compost metagenome]